MRLRFKFIAFFTPNLVTDNGIDSDWCIRHQAFTSDAIPHDIEIMLGVEGKRKPFGLSNFLDCANPN